MFKAIIKALKENICKITIILLGLSIFGFLVSINSKDYILIVVWGILIIVNCFNVYNSKFLK